MGKTGDILVNRLGFTTIKEAAIAQCVATQSSTVIVASIETLDVCTTDVAVTEKRRTVHPAAPSPYTRPKAPSGDARIVRVTRGQTLPPHNFRPTSHIPFTTSTPAPAPPAIVFVPSTPKEEDIVAPDHIEEHRTPRRKTWSNCQLAARDKLRAGGLGNLVMMEFKSLINPSVWNWVWEDKEAVVSYIGEDDFVTVSHVKGEVFSADDAMGTLSMNKKLPRGFLRGPPPYVIVDIGELKESHCASLDTGSQVNIL